MNKKIMILGAWRNNGFLLNSEMLNFFLDFDENFTNKIIKIVNNLDIGKKVIDKEFFLDNFDKMKDILSDNSKKIINSFLFDKKNDFKLKNKVKNDFKPENIGKKVKVLSSPVVLSKKNSVSDFVLHFRNKYNVLKGFLEKKKLENLTSLRKIDKKRGNYSIIVSILEKRVTKNKNLLLKVEDLTGVSRILVGNNKKELFCRCKDLMLDDVVGFSVSGNSEWLYADKLVFPDSFLLKEKKSSFDEVVAFSSDFHVGSDVFSEKPLLKFIDWLNGDVGDEKQRKFAKKVKYLLVVGDSVDGVGVNPGQNERLNILDIKKQYEVFAKYLKMIRSDVEIVICPGQHDSVWVGHPQFPINERWASDLYRMKNVTMVSNPSLIEISDGFKILMYHGAGMHSFVDEIQNIRLNYGHRFPLKVVKELLKRRYLLAGHGFSDYVLSKKDNMIIDVLPDIITTGDWHRSEVGFYNGIFMVACSCWQKRTSSEEKIGDIPDPYKVPLFNLMTRDVKIADFGKESNFGLKECDLACDLLGECNG